MLAAFFFVASIILLQALSSLIAAKFSVEAYDPNGCYRHQHHPLVWLPELMPWQAHHLPS